MESAALRLRMTLPSGELVPLDADRLATVVREAWAGLDVVSHAAELAEAQRRRHLAPRSRAGRDPGAAHAGRNRAELCQGRRRRGLSPDRKPR